MKKSIPTILTILLLSSLPEASAQTSGTPTEAQLIAILQSTAPPEQKDAACVQLKRIGTATAVPALARLLVDPQLSHSARYALESMPAPEATAALVAALADARNEIKAGLLQSLGERRDMPVAPVARYLNDSNPDIVIAAALALGKRGGAEVLKLLTPLLDKTTGPVRTTVVDALLRAAEGLQDGPQASAALRVYDRLTGAKEPAAVRQAAWCGLLRADKKRRLTLLRQCLTGTDAVQQRAALEVASSWNIPDVKLELARLLPKLAPPLQASVIDLLRRLNAREAAGAIAAALANSESYVRVAAVNALAEVGNASHAPALLKSAVSQDAEEQKAARRALARLKDPLADSLLKWLPAAEPNLQSEIIQTLANRQETDAVPRLLEVARTGPDNAGNVALRAVGQLAQPNQLAPLVEILSQATDDSRRLAAQEALQEACRRLQARPDFSPEPLVAGLQGPAAARAALYPVLAQLRHERARAALLKGRQESDSQARTAALRALCDAVDPAVVPTLIELAKTVPENNIRVLAVRGAARLVGEDAASPSGQRAATLRELLGLATRAEEKRMILGRLPSVPTLESLELSANLTADASLQNEAAQALAEMTGSLSGAHPAECTRALQTALKNVTNDARRRDLQSRLQQIEALADYLTVWQVAGPYQQAGKSYQELFDIVFPPEKDNAGGIVWKPLPAGADAQRPFVMDVLKALGGEQRVAYLRTRVYSDKEQPARLEFGSDDGVKIWLNGKQVAALNVARPLAPGSDKVDVTLQAGWNTLMVKLTQNNQGWEFCARFVKRDGSRLVGLKSRLPE